MHYIIAFLGALAGLFWAFTHFSNAARQGKDAVDEVRGAFRRGRWSRQIDKRLIETLDDPREAAAILLYQTAAYDGALTERQRTALVQEMKTAFDMDQETAEGLLAFARMALGEITDVANSLRKVLTPIKKVCSTEEKQIVIKMMESIAQIEGARNDQQNLLISQTRHGLISE